jgi:hypothetical protein
VPGTIGFMNRRYPQHSSYGQDTRPGPQVSGPMAYGAGFTGTRETLEGRDYYPNNGGLRSEWRASRNTITPDRLFPRAPHPFTVWFRAVLRYWTDWLICAGAITTASACVWAGWTLAREGGVAVAVAVVSTIYTSIIRSETDVRS